MARQGSPIDPRRFAHSNLKDVLQLVAGDLCDAHVNAQQKAVITVKPGLRIDETNMHGEHMTAHRARTTRRTTYHQAVVSTVVVDPCFGMNHQRALVVCCVLLWA